MILEVFPNHSDSMILWSSWLGFMTYIYFWKAGNDMKDGNIFL